MRLLLLIGAALAGVLLFLLATASANTALFARHYSLLLGLNAALAALLAALVVWQLVLLVRRYRQREFGSRLRLRLLVMLGLMALAPGALVYIVSEQFLARSIESWYDVKVDAALEGAKFLGQSSIDHSVLLRETWRGWRRVDVNVAYAYGIESFEDLTADRLGSLDATTIAAGLRVRVPSLTFITTTWEHQWRSNETRVDRLTLSVVRAFR